MNRPRLTEIEQMYLEEYFALRSCGWSTERAMRLIEQVNQNADAMMAESLIKSSQRKPPEGA